MKWPWSRPEIRSSNYTDLVVASLFDAATGANGSTAIAAIESAAGLWARCIASATLTPQSPATAPLTPTLLADVARRLCMFGEALFVIDVRGAAVVLHPVSAWDVTGGFEPESWSYRCQLAGPSTSVTRTAPYDSVLHFLYSSDAIRPYQGVGPLSRCSETKRLATALERSLRYEASGPVGSFLAVPEGANPKGDADVDPLAGLRTGIAGARGAPILHESVVPGYGDKGNAPFSDLRPTRFGANWPTAVSEARDPIGASILAACGVPPTLAAVSSDGTAQRESFRRFLLTTIQPLGKIIETELKLKLDPSASLAFPELAASDITGKARAIGSLTKAGMSIEDARAVAGL